ncbi:MAG TPA: hypothetical protein PKM73_01315 [Verrucomicrobiota bacterium]|nr:hypothetical protein [Verrucomicrobiota bacterium]HNU50023.1 hypothetical protein [Verrucomicrobiota bacterium]
MAGENCYGFGRRENMSIERGLLTGKVGMDRVFSPGECWTNAGWNPWFLLSTRRRVLE